MKLDVFRDAIKKAMPHLPYSQVNILKQLSQCETTYKTRESGLYYLEKHNYIKQLHEVSSGLFVFEINPLVKSELSNYLKSERIKKVEELAENITEEEREFLALFFDTELPERTNEDSKTWMTNKVHKAGESMSYQNIIEVDRNKGKKHIDSFSLPEDTAKILETTVFKKKPKRSEILIDLNHVYGSGASGTGAVPTR